MITFLFRTPLLPVTRLCSWKALANNLKILSGPLSLSLAGTKQISSDHSSEMSAVSEVWMLFLSWDSWTSGQAFDVGVR